MHVKKGDNVIVITGSSKGKKGVIAKSFPKTNMVVITGVNTKKRSQKARKSSEKGQVVEVSMPINASNVRKQK